MLRYFKGHLGLVLSALSLAVFAQLLTPISALMEREMIGYITDRDMAGFAGTLWAAGAIVLAVAVTSFLGGFTQRTFQAKLGEDLRADLFDGVMGRSVRRFEEYDTAKYISYISSAAGNVANNLTGPVLDLVAYGISAVTVLVLMIRFSPLLAALSVVSGAVSAVLPLVFNKQLQARGVEIAEAGAAMSVELKEALNGHRVITAFGVFPRLRGRFTRASARVGEASRRMGHAVAGIENVGRVCDRAAWFVVFLIAGTMTAREEIDLGTLVMFISLFGYFSGVMTIYASVLPLLLSEKKNIRMLLDLRDSAGAELAGTREPSFTDKLKVRDLSFRYTPEAPVLEHLDLTLRKNEKLALVGPSGCGKSTLIRLLSGDFADYSGSICFDGTELHDIAPDKLRGLVTVIQQNTFLFNDTLRFNICLGEEFPQEDLDRALRMSGVDRFLPSVEGGLEGDCGENGSRLSGGQRQRVALARAFIRGVKVLLLDEGVSAIDVTAANELEAELLNMPDLTLLTITHRLKDGLTDQYDRVLVMENGRLRERDTAIE